jgi:hypothetical protein
MTAGFTQYSTILLKLDYAAVGYLLKPNSELINYNLGKAYRYSQAFACAYSYSCQYESEYRRIAWGALSISALARMHMTKC